MEREKHIVIDCFKLVKGMGKSLGIYNVTQRILRELLSARPEARITVLGTKYNREDFALPGVNFVEIDKDPHSRLTCILWELFTVSRVVKKLKADKVLFPRGFCAMTHPVWDIVLVHDMIPFYYHTYYPGVLPRLENFYIRWRLKASVRSAKQVITISEASKADILRYAHCKPEKITVIVNGSNPVYHHAEEGGGYFFAMTSALPHKNAKGIVAAYEAYLALAPQPLPLRIVGLKSLDGYTENARAKEMITCTAYIRDNRELHRQVARAKAFLFLSLIEGFGSPPVEAMLLGVPVISSNRTALPEACGDAALYVDPEKPEEAAEAMLRLQNDEKLCKELIEKGYENNRRLSWESRAKLYWEVLDQ